MEKFVDVEVRRKAKIDDEWVILDKPCRAIMYENRIMLLLNEDTTYTFKFDDKRAWWLETEKGAFMGAFIRESTYERDGIEITTEWEYVVRSL